MPIVHGRPVYIEALGAARERREAGQARSCSARVISRVERLDRDASTRVPGRRPCPQLLAAAACQSAEVGRGRRSASDRRCDAAPLSSPEFVRSWDVRSSIPKPLSSEVERSRGENLRVSTWRRASTTLERRGR
jgi:hypothetical protein